MRMVPLQWASLVVIFLDAVIIAFGFVTGSALLPRSANLVLVVISMALMVATRTTESCQAVDLAHA